MLIAIVPDVHGRKFWHDIEYVINEVDKVIFLGDYLDPYPDENISFEDALEEFKQILTFKEKYNNKVILLTGNHDLGYIITDFPDCSRRNYKLLNELNKLFNEHINKFQLIYKIDNYLFSHAGIYNHWMDLCKFNLSDLGNFSKMISDNWPSLTCTGFLRGGYFPTGSCVWADLRESLNYDLYSNSTQIVGHTQLDKPYFGDKIKCLDVRECFVLDTKNNIIKKLKEYENSK